MENTTLTQEEREAQERRQQQYDRIMARLKVWARQVGPERVQAVLDQLRAENKARQAANKLDDERREKEMRATAAETDRLLAYGEAQDERVAETLREGRRFNL